MLSTTGKRSNNSDDVDDEDSEEFFDDGARDSFDDIPDDVPSMPVREVTARPTATGGSKGSSKAPAWSSITSTTRLSSPRQQQNHLKQRFVQQQGAVIQSQVPQTVRQGGVATTTKPRVGSEPFHDSRNQDSVPEV